MDYFTGEVMKTPVSEVPTHKRSFVPSKLDARKVVTRVSLWRESQVHFKIAVGRKAGARHQNGLDTTARLGEA